MAFAFFFAATWVFLFICMLVYNGGQAIVGTLVGAKVDEVSVGTNLFLGAFKSRILDIECTWGILPITGYTKFRGMSDEPERTEEASESNTESGAANFNQLPIVNRMCILAIGPILNFFIGVIFLAMPVLLGGPRLAVDVDAATQILSTSVPDLSVDDEPIGWRDQWQLLNDTFFAFVNRAITGQSLKGWGGPIGWIVTTSIAGTYSSSAWLSCVGVIGIAWSFLNLLPLPILNGGKLLMLASESVFGAIPANFENGLLLVSLLLALVLYVGLLTIDAYWAIGQFA